MSDLPIGSATWRVVLADWWHASAEVTITLRSGVQLTGKLPRHPASDLPGLATLRSCAGDQETVHSIDLTDVAAITARGTR